MSKEQAGLRTPDRWSWSQMRHVTNVLRRGTSPVYVDDGEIRVLGQACVQPDGISWSRARFHDYSGDARKLRGFLEPDDLLVNSTGTGTLGRVGYFGGHEGHAVIADSHITLVRVDRTQLEPRFLYYYLSSKVFQCQLFNELVAGATNQIELSPEKMCTSMISYPSIEEQRKIADFLDIECDVSDRLVAARRSQADLLSARLNRVVDVFADNAAPGAGVRIKFVTTRITSGPRGWGDLVADAEEATPFVRIANIRRNDIQLRLDNLQRVDAPAGAERERTRTQEGDVVVSITADIGAVGLIGRETSGGNVSQHVALLRPAPNLCTSEWLAYSLLSTKVRQSLTTSSYGGTKVGLGLSEVGNTSIALPSLEQQRTLNRKIEACAVATREIFQKLTKQVDLVVERKQALITAAVTGEIDVSTARGVAE